ncbi:ABC transporter ATP-binding protein [bacterium]|nr:ABC transporter ATP-binding protein [bacterium]
MTTLLKVEKITKKFGDFYANDQISFEVKKSEVLAILGENGAGKTTLMNILFGHYTPDDGNVYFEGNAIEFGNTNNAIKLGIGMVHQHFTLAENLTVLENIIIGRQSIFSLSLPKRQARVKILELSKKFGLPIDPDELVANLSVSEKQRIEILKTLFLDCKLLILDEPTAALTPQETDALFSTIRNMIKTGLSVILISHKLNEILAVSDRIIVLRNGSSVGEIDTHSAEREKIAEMIVGKKIDYPQKTKIPRKSKVLRLLDVSYNKADAPNLSRVNLDLYGGQILGIAGVAGNGQTTLAKILAGHFKPTQGKIVFEEAKSVNTSPKSFMDLGVAYIPEDRNSDGIVGDMEIWENAIMTEMDDSFFRNSLGIINKRKSFDRSENLCETYDVRMQSIRQRSRLLSGGNVQKLLLGRWLMRKPKIIIACQPTRGLDEGAIASIQKLLLEAQQNGSAIILISEDLDELLTMSDDISVMYKGMLSNPTETSSINKLSIGLQMAGDGFL